MEKGEQIRIFEKLGKIIFELFDKQEWLTAKTEKLQEIFFKNLDEVMTIAYDLNLSVDKLKDYVGKVKGKDKESLIEAGKFLVESLDNKKTYVLLNYYLYKFIQVILAVVKKENLAEVEGVLKQSGLEEKEIQAVKKNYKELVESSN